MANPREHLQEMKRNLQKMISEGQGVEFARDVALRNIDTAIDSAMELFAVEVEQGGGG